jgi:ribonuclease BN (tRNA processing enzyme)
LLTLTFLGVGSAFAKRNYQSNALVEAWTHGPVTQSSPDETLLIDFGSSGPRALHDLRGKPGFEYLGSDERIDYSSIDSIFITHQHGDHYGGLEELAIVNLLAQTGGGSQEPTLPQLIAVGDLPQRLWKHSLSGALEAAVGRRAGLNDYFRVRSLTEPTDPQFSLVDRYDFRPFATNHVRIDEPLDWPSYGLTISERQSGRTVFYSGDTRFDRERLEPMMAHAKQVFHEVQLESGAATVHALLSELQTLPPDIRRKMILYHFGDNWDHADYASVASDFGGFATPHHRYVLFE